MQKTKGIECLPLTIGILGIERGAGTTHLSIMTAGYLSSKERKKTAIVEFNHDNAFEAVKTLYYGEFCGKEADFQAFELKGIDYFYGITIEQYTQIINMGYEYIVLDLGSFINDNYSELMRCDIKCIVGNASEWNILKFDRFLDRFYKKNNNVGINFLYVFGNKRLVKKLEKAYKVNLYNIPFEPSPYELHSSSFPFLAKLCNMENSNKRILSQRIHRGSWL